MRQIAPWIFLAMLTFPGLAHGQRSCLPPDTALQTVQVIDPLNPVDFRYSLKERRAGSLVETRVLLQGQLDKQNPHLVRLSVAFDPDFEGVSLPYNLYALLVLRDGEVLGWWDYTRACQGPGLSFFPGREIELPILKLVGDKPQTLQIMVWGRL